jgi:glycerate kinase
MRAVLAPDSFKGCLSSPEVAAALAEGLRDVWPDVETVARPLADGGEGTLSALAAALPGTLVPTRVRGPHGEAVDAAWWRSADGRLGVVEMARASGLSVTSRRAPLAATTFGTGELVAAAFAAGAGEVWVGAGGSATVDGGAGALAALGCELLDAGGRPTLDPARVERIVAPSPRGALRVLCDVRNPLLGPEGAAAVYGPQKGASPADVPVLEAGLARFASRLAATFGRDPAHLAGAGAAGGLAGGLWAALGAELRPGFDAVADLVGLDAAIADADLVLTGEGRVDAQTAYGKTVAGVLRRAAGRPVWVFGGEVTEAGERWCAAEGGCAVPIAAGPASLESSLAAARPLLRRAAARAARLRR